MKYDSRVWFMVLCVLWGTNWLAIKLAVTQTPPIASATARAVLCGVIMLVLARPRRVWALFAAAPWRSVAVSILTSAVTYAAMYWGTARLSTGLAAIVNHATTPIGLLLFGYAFREETLSRRRIAGIALGAIGLALLFARRTGGSFDAASIAGIAAVLGGTLAYCLGSVWSRPLLRSGEPMAVGSVQMLVGGVLLVPISWLIERPTGPQLAAMLDPVPLACLAWLVFAGGIAGLNIYLRLIRDWGPSRAGMYAFVSPILATILGALVLGERLGALEAAGAAVLFAAAALVLRGASGAQSLAGSAAAKP